MRTHILEESSWDYVKSAGLKVALLPWGATEAHNYHLPYGTDTILAEHIAGSAAEIANKKGAGSIVLPSIAYGVNSGQMEVKLCMNINPSTQLAILRDILNVLEIHNIKKLVIVNAHGGNAFQPIIRELSLEFPNIIMISLNWWTICKQEQFFKEPGDHAGELETSCLQAIAPDMVAPLEKAGKGAEKKFKIKGLKEKWAWTPRRWIYISEDTGVGNPAAATPEKGEEFMRCCISSLAEFIVEISGINSEEELYER
jgi:creatinine amidohydrolase